MYTGRNPFRNGRLETVHSVLSAREQLDEQLDDHVDVHVHVLIVDVAQAGVLLLGIDLQQGITT